MRNLSSFLSSHPSRCVPRWCAGICEGLLEYPESGLHSADARQCGPLDPTYRLHRHDAPFRLQRLRIRKMSVECGDSMAMVDDDGAPVSVDVLGGFNKSISGSYDRSAKRAGDIYFGMKSAFTVKWINALTEGPVTIPSTGHNEGAAASRSQSLVLNVPT